MRCEHCGYDDELMKLAWERLRYVFTEICLICDALLLLCSLFWRKKIKSGVVRDSADDLLDLRKETII